MSVARRLLLAAAAVVALALGAGAGTASAADECRGLMVCLPVEGPWVVVPGAAPGAAAKADWILACPREGYLVAGTDVRLTDRAIDVGIRGETGSPVAPGTTTREAVRFSGLFAGLGRRPVAFRPFIGCIPTSGGGARSQTARAAQRDGLKPTRPVTYVAVGQKLAGRTSRIAGRCPAGSRLVDWGHAVSFHTALPPAPAVLRQVTTTARVAAATGTVTVTASATSSSLSSAPEVQIQLACTKAVR